jgi:hypothetical protein
MQIGIVFLEGSIRANLAGKAIPQIKSIPSISSTPQQLEISLIPCTTSSLFTAPHGYLVGTWPIIFARADPKPSIVLTFSLPENANFEAHYVSFGACRLVRIHSEPPAIRTKKSLDFGLLCRNVYEALVGTLDRGLSYRRM